MADPHVARRAKLLAGLDSLRTGSNLRDLVNERTLMVAGGVLAPLGLLLVLFGWMGASRSPYTFEQIPYLISGGLIGLGLTVLGGFLYFAHWITEMIKEQRRQTDAVVEAIAELRAELAATSTAAPSSTNGVAPAPRRRPTRSTKG